MWSRRSKHILLGRTWSKLRCFGRVGQNVSRLIKLGRTWSKHKCFGRAGRKVSGMVEPGQKTEVCDRADRNISPWSNLVET